MAKSRLISGLTKAGEWATGKKKKKGRAGLTKAEIRYVKSLRTSAKRRKKKPSYSFSEKARYFKAKHLSRKQKTIY